MKRIFFGFAACCLVAGSVWAGGTPAKNASQMGWHDVQFNQRVPQGVLHCNWAGLYLVDPQHTDWTKLTLYTTRTAKGVKVGEKCYFKIAAQRDTRNMNNPYERAIAVMIAK